MLCICVYKRNMIRTLEIYFMHFYSFLRPFFFVFLLSPFFFFLFIFFFFLFPFLFFLFFFFFFSLFLFLFLLLLSFLFLHRHVILQLFYLLRFLFVILFIRHTTQKQPIRSLTYDGIFTVELATPSHRNTWED